MTVTVDDIRTWHLRQECHFDGAGWFGDEKRCVENPRLSRFEKCVKKTRTVETIWRVDGADVADLDAAAEALSRPPVTSEEDRAFLRRLPLGRDEWRPLMQEHYERWVSLRSRGLATHAEDKSLVLTELGQSVVDGEKS